MRRGLLGGTFDPIHNGHLGLAAAAIEALALDGVWFLPAGTPWMRRGAPCASREARKEMVELAIAGDPRFHLLTNELDRPGVTYTVDTLEELARADWLPDETYFLLGADALAGVHLWKQPRRLLQLARLAVAPREGGALELAELSDAAPDAVARIAPVEMAPVAVSSTALRERVAAGESIRGSVPGAVARYIKERRLYQGPVRAGASGRAGCSRPVRAVRWRSRLGRWRSR